MMYLLEIKPILLLAFSFGVMELIHDSLKLVPVQEAPERGWYEENNNDVQA